MEEDNFDDFIDFTTASEWESCIAKLEGMLSEFMAKPVDPDDNVINNWVVVHEKMAFGDFPFKLSYFKKLSGDSNQDMMQSSIMVKQEGEGQLPDYLSAILKGESEFPPKPNPHAVSEYFNLSEFAVLSSAGIEPVEKESMVKILLSSACIAINNTNCHFPVFVQSHQWSQSYFSGIAESSGIRTSFDTVMLNPVPNPSLPTHLSGLLDIMKSKIGSNLPCPVGICAHFFYKVHDWSTEVNCDSFPPELFELLCADKAMEDEEQSNKEQWSHFYAHASFLPFGSLDDPFKSLDLVAGWPNLTEDVVVDSPTYTDLEPENAQEWYFSLRPDPEAEFRLHELLQGMWKLKHDRRTTAAVLGKSIENKNDSQEFASALDRITKAPVPVPDLNQMLRTTRRKPYFSSDPNAYEELAPMSKEKMEMLTDFLFPDAKLNPKYPYPASFQDSYKFTKDYINVLSDNLNGVKSAPVGSLVYRFAIISGYLLVYGDEGGSSSALAYLWAELVLELRFRVENSKLVCGLESGSPNIGSCLLNQKLQMLNCCIEKKIARELKQCEKAEDFAEESDDEDEFFDCEEDTEGNNDTGKQVNKPSGRVRKNGKLRLIKTGEPMYIPDTQDPAPLTEDILEEQSRVMIELGDDSQGSELRAKMMSASLHSDMESFKAANPGAVLEDFVRWYSPRDWIETDQLDKYGNPVGELSPRMKVPGNLWLEVWSTANPVPARRQKRLFDDTKEAEKVLHWLSTRTLRDISQLLFPTLVHAAAVKVMDEMDTLPFNYEIPSQFLSNIVALSRSFHCVAQLDQSSEDEINGYKNAVMRSLQQCEKEITQIKSFQMKFPSESITNIFSQSCKNSAGDADLLPTFIKVPDGKRSNLGKRIFDLFVNASSNESENQTEQQDNSNPTSKFGRPFKRVFVLKYCPHAKGVDHSSPFSLPHRMSCVLRNDRFILAGTFSNKTSLT